MAETEYFLDDKERTWAGRQCLPCRLANICRVMCIIKFSSCLAAVKMAVDYSSVSMHTSKHSCVPASVNWTTQSLCVYGVRGRVLGGS